MTNDREEAARKVAFSGIELLHGGEEGKRNRARAYWAAWVDLLKLGPAALPSGLHAQLIGHLEYLAAGIIPAPIADCAGPGNPVGPSEEKDIRAAVVYAIAAQRGLITDKFYVKTIGTIYRASRHSVEGWIRKRRETISAEELTNPEAIISAMRGAGERYSVSGRTHKANEAKHRKTRGS
ncbi:hypothetical protein [Bradyrhizobium sp. WSM1743]|uniref:hypothetical protein n=1 Tax=Bradyrhizobium sp. WSM1743 TaxID=318996 RepID=UPI0012ECB7E3|nr:hypothetical protein [Bradyrhizobium sp. WSM1743]